MAPGEMAFLVLYMVAVPVKKSDDFIRNQRIHSEIHGIKRMRRIG